MSSLDEWRSEAYENAKLFKEKVKRWHDKRILSVQRSAEGSSSTILAQRWSRSAQSMMNLPGG